MLASDQIPVTTSASKLFDGLKGRVIVSSATAFFIGGANVTASNGVPIPANFPVELTVTVDDSVWAVVTTGTAQVGYFAGAQ